MQSADASASCAVVFLVHAPIRRIGQQAATQPAAIPTGGSISLMASHTVPVPTCRTRADTRCTHREMASSQSSFRPFSSFLSTYYSSTWLQLVTHAYHWMYCSALHQDFFIFQLSVHTILRSLVLSYTVALKQSRRLCFPLHLVVGLVVLLLIIDVIDLGLTQ